jgi:hypothetical protein
MLVRLLIAFSVKPVATVGVGAALDGVRAADRCRPRLVLVIGLNRAFEQSVQLADAGNELS